METILSENIYRLGIIPVLQIDNADRAVPVGEALSAGGLPIAEITFRSDAALDSIRKVARELPHILVGAGTVIHIEQAKAAYDAGAKFLISPGLDEGLLTWSQENHIPLIPGAITPTE